MDKEVLIIGAGLAGLTVAYELEKKGISYRIIEARKKVGGRIRTVTTDSGAAIEMGATWFSDKHVNLIQLIDELQVPYENQFVGNKVIYDYQNGGRRIEEMMIPSGQEPYYVFSHGSESLIEALYEKIDHSKVCLGEQINSLLFSNGQWKIIACKRVFNVDVVVNTLPPNLFVNTIRLDPALPKNIIDLSKSTHTWMGDSIKVGAEITEDLWRDRKIGAFFSQFGPAVELHDHIHDRQGVPVLMGFLDQHFRRMSSSERKNEFLKQIALYFDKPGINLTNYFEVDWQKEEHTFFPYYAEILPHENNGNKVLREPMFEKHLFFAGSETARSFPGYMDGAVERGVEVSEGLMKLLKNKNRLNLQWQR